MPTMKFLTMITLTMLSLVNGTKFNVPGYTHRFGFCNYNDIKSIGRARLFECVIKCDELPTCLSFEFVDMGNHTENFCLLKNVDCMRLTSAQEGKHHIYTKDVFIPGITDNPSSLATVHSYQKGPVDPSTAACQLSGIAGFKNFKDTILPLGQSVKSDDCKTFTCHGVFENGQSDLALVSELFGCLNKGKCPLVGSKFKDDRCYTRICRITRSKADRLVRPEIKFANTIADCPTADGACVKPGAKYFDCFFNGAYESHCVCKKKGAMIYLDSLMGYGPKVATIGGNAKGSYCFFKFKADGEMHNECILGNRDRTWCAVTEDYDRDGKWGYCTERPPHRFTTDHLGCHLPFKYNGTLYHDCTTDGGEDGKPWCSTQFLYDPTKKGDCELSL